METLPRRSEGPPWTKYPGGWIPPQIPSTFGVTSPLQRPSAGPPRHQGHALLQVKELIDKVRAVFVDTLDELSWMDESSKKKAQEKVGRRPGKGGPSVRAMG